MPGFASTNGSDMPGCSGSFLISAGNGIVNRGTVVEDELVAQVIKTCSTILLQWENVGCKHDHVDMM
jgi:hypothetical protein